MFRKHLVKQVALVVSEFSYGLSKVENVYDVVQFSGVVELKLSKQRTQLKLSKQHTQLKLSKQHTQQRRQNKQTKAGDRQVKGQGQNK